MRRRLLVAQLVVVVAVLVVLELPLAIVYSRHEHDALNAALQRDAATLAAVSSEIVEHPDEHDLGDFARQFPVEPGEVVTIVDRAGVELTPPNVVSNDPDFRTVLDGARARRAGTGERGGLTYVAVPLGAVGEDRGAVLVARSDESIDDRVQHFWFLLVGLAAAVLGVCLFVSSRLSRWVVDPLRRLDDQAAALGRGQLTVRADTSSGPPEVVTLAATFNEMADRLDELVTSQRRFVADASHQLRTPLTALRLRLENLDPETPDRVAATRDAALAETVRLTRLVDGLLALARAEGRRPEREQATVTATLAERHEAWAPLAAEQGVELRVVNGATVPLMASLVPGHLEQILDNLINNALDASSPGDAVELRAVKVGPSIEVHVTDQGPGMTDDERRRAFDPFWQGPDGCTTGGTGLGLAIVEQLARASRGSVTLEPSPGGGIDAVVRFPSTSLTG